MNKDKIIREHMSKLGKESQKKNPLTTERSREMNEKRWKKQKDLSPEK